MTSLRNRIKHVLKGMRVMEVSLVDEGDNPGADVVVVKRREQSLAGAVDDFAHGVAELNVLADGDEGAEGVARATEVLKGMNMNIEELNEKLGQIEASLETVEKDRDEAIEKVTALEASLAERDAEIEKLKADGGKSDGGASDGADDDDVLKGLPEPVRKRILDAEAKAARAEEAIEKANDKRATDEAIAKAKSFGFADADALGQTLFRIEKGVATAEDREVVEQALTKAKALVEAEGKLFEDIGKGNGGNADDAEAKLNEAALTIQKAKPTLSYEAAYAEAMDANPELYDAVQKARRAN